jgi:hypothetical protein
MHTCCTGPLTTSRGKKLDVAWLHAPRQRADHQLYVDTCLTINCQAGAARACLGAYAQGKKQREPFLSLAT